MATLQELKDMLKSFVGGCNYDATTLYESLEKIPVVEGDLMLYTPSRPVTEDQLEYINVIGPDDNVYPLYLQRLIRRDGYGCYIKSKPASIFKKFYKDFSLNEVLHPMGDGRSLKRCMRLPLTLDFYDFFNSKERGLNQFLVFLISFLFDLNDVCVPIFMEERPKTNCTHFSYNNPYVSEMTFDDIIREQKKLIPYLESICFKEKIQLDSYDSEVSKLIDKNVIYKNEKVIYKGRVRDVQFCSLCANLYYASAHIKMLTENESEPFKKVIDKVESGARERYRWSYSNDEYDLDVINSSQYVASAFFRIAIASLNPLSKGSFRHDHFLPEDAPLEGVEKKDQFLVSVYEDQDVFEEKKYSSFRSFLKDYLILKGVSIPNSDLIIKGKGVFLSEVPIEVFVSMPFFKRNTRKVFMQWNDDLLCWLDAMKRSGVYKESSGGSLGNLVSWYRKIKFK